MKRTIVNIENLLKLLLSKVNRPDNKIVTQVIPEEKKIDTQIIPGMKPNVRLINNRLVKVGEDTEEKNDSTIIEEESVHSGKRRLNRTNNEQSLDKKVPVRQRIVYPDGKNVCLASVEIFDINGKLVAQAKTNSTGQWISSLVPGTYNVKVNKNAAGNKPAISLNNTISVPLSDLPIELETK